MADPIHETIENWHRYLKGALPGGLDALLHDDVAFLSPVVFRPQQGKAIAKLYLRAAQQALPGEPPSGSGSSGSFRYVKEILSGHHAALEFETQVNGKYVNGVDLITCDDSGRIVEFRVMVRPLQALNAVHEQMRAMLERMSQ